MTFSVFKSIDDLLEEIFDLARYTEAANKETTFWLQSVAGAEPIFITRPPALLQ